MIDSNSQQSCILRREKKNDLTGFIIAVPIYWCNTFCSFYNRWSSHIVCSKGRRKKCSHLPFYSMEKREMDVGRILQTWCSSPCSTTRIFFFFLFHSNIFTFKFVETMKRFFARKLAQTPYDMPDIIFGLLSISKNYT